MISRQANHQTRQYNMLRLEGALFILFVSIASDGRALSEFGNGMIA
jgi:hypothetical protein